MRTKACRKIENFFSCLFKTCGVCSTASDIEQSEFLAEDPEDLGSIPGTPRFFEK
jgi:hypothetical protein